MGQHIAWNPTPATKEARRLQTPEATPVSTLGRLGLLAGGLGLGAGAAYGASHLGDMIPGLSGEGTEAMQTPPTPLPDLLDGASTGLKNVPVQVPELDMPAPDDPSAFASDALPGPAPEIDAGMQAQFVRGMPPVGTPAWGNALMTRPVRFE